MEFVELHRMPQTSQVSSAGAWFTFLSPDILCGFATSGRKSIQPAKRRRALLKSNPAEK